MEQSKSSDQHSLKVTKETQGSPEEPEGQNVIIKAIKEDENLGLCMKINSSSDNIQYNIGYKQLS